MASNLHWFIGQERKNYYHTLVPEYAASWTFAQDNNEYEKIYLLHADHKVIPLFYNKSLCLLFLHCKMFSIPNLDFVILK